MPGLFWECASFEQVNAFTGQNNFRIRRCHIVDVMDVGTDSALDQELPHHFYISSESLMPGCFETVQSIAMLLTRTEIINEMGGEHL